MSANSAFNTQGAVPNMTPVPTGGSYSGTTPKSKALNNVQSGFSSSYSPSSFTSPTVSAPTVTKPAPVPVASTPLKKTTTNNVDGSSTTHEYHAPEVGTQKGLIPPPTPYEQSTNSLNAIGSGRASSPVAGAIGNLQNQGTNYIDPNNPSASVNTQNAQKVQGLLQGFATNSSPAVTEANKEYTDFSKKSPFLLSDVRNNPNVAAEVSVGRGQALGQTLTAEQQALAQGVTNALSEQNQQIGAAENAGTQSLTGQNQQINALNNAGNLGVNQQNTQVSALQNAGNLTKPEQLAYGTQYGSPADLAKNNAGGVGSGGALNPLNNVQSIAQQVISGQISPSQAYAMGGNIQNWQGVINQAIQGLNPSFNTATAEGRFAANQANTTTSGVTPVNAAADVYGKAYGEYLDLKNITENVDQFGKLLTGSMIDEKGNVINPSDAKFANKALSEIRGQLSSKQQAVFDNTYASLKARVSGLLAMGGTQIPTQITTDANKILDGSLPLKSLDAVLQRIGTEGNILLANQQGKLNTAGGVIGAQKVGAPTTDVNALRSKYGY